MHGKSRYRQPERGAPPLVMGILNVTPDSFSDGGDHFAIDDAVRHAVAMISEGADIIDVGPESTRPGAKPVSSDEQIDRAVPVIEAVRKRHDGVAISIDTRLAPVARAALEAGADIVNDVSALRDDPDMPGCVAASGAAVVLMHMRGRPADMQTGDGPQYKDVVSEIASFLVDRRTVAIAAGIDPSRIIFDPGIGFGKRVEDNLAILRRLDRFVALGQPVLVGASRKSFLGHILGIEEPKRRDAGSLTCAVVAAIGGAAIIRTHDVCATAEAMRVLASVACR